ncbi:hypothetical protein JNB85_17685 [Rhizobium mesosinicum]|uniref:Uncharacterized protein n=1 Tax=Rhizobium mesosinicum TaxID=335017 RepID=A0ABS7GWB7_9HYPH|nr:hypothetical protein [Rhizobium mesosinicum]
MAVDRQFLRIAVAYQPRAQARREAAEQNRECGLVGLISTLCKDGEMLSFPGIHISSRSRCGENFGLNFHTLTRYNGFEKGQTLA